MNSTWKDQLTFSYPSARQFHVLEDEELQTVGKSQRFGSTPSQAASPSGTSPEQGHVWFGIIPGHTG